MKLSATQLKPFSIVSVSAVLTTVIAVQGYAIKPAHAGNLIVNGSFEEGTSLKDGGWSTYKSILGWQATSGGNIEVQRGAAGAAQHGKQLVELDSHFYNERQVSTIGIFQDINTRIGGKYRLSFFYSPRPGTTATENKFQVLFQNKTSQSNDFSALLDGGAGGRQTRWTQYSTTFVASGNTSRLLFNYDVKNDVQNTYGSYIDNVSLETVPEPGTLTGLALVGLGAVVRKRFRG